MTVCASLHELAELTWDHMQYQLNHGYRSPDERAFTDHHLVELSIRHEPHVRAKLFTISDEKNTGADFEMWFQSGDDFVAALVQAKKLDRAGQYPGLDRSVGSGPNPRRQIDMLINACTTGPFSGHLPLYLFYNGPPASMPSDRCCDPNVGLKQRGCTFARARDVRSLLDAVPDPPHKAVTDIGPAAVPWQCLLCCPRFDGAGALRQRLFTFGQGSFFAVLWASAPRADTPRIWDRAELPDYARLLASAAPDDDTAARDSALRPGADRVVLFSDGG